MKTIKTKKSINVSNAQYDCRSTQPEPLWYHAYLFTGGFLILLVAIGVACFFVERVGFEWIGGLASATALIVFIFDHVRIKRQLNQAGHQDLDEVVGSFSRATEHLRNRQVHLLQTALKSELIFLFRK